MVVRMRVTKGHRNNRRSHHGLKMPRLSKCTNCDAWHLRHRMCAECGNYRGRIVVDMVAKKTKKLEKRQARLEAQGVVTEEKPETEKKDTKKVTAPKKEKTTKSKKTVDKKVADK